MRFAGLPQGAGNDIGRLLGNLIHSIPYGMYRWCVLMCRGGVFLYDWYHVYWANCIVPIMITVTICHFFEFGYYCSFGPIAMFHITICFTTNVHPKQWQGNLEQRVIWPNIPSWHDMTQTWTHGTWTHMVEAKQTFVDECRAHQWCSLPVKLCWFLLTLNDRIFWLLWEVCHFTVLVLVHEVILTL